MEDTELYLLTPVLESLAKVTDCRTIIKSIVFEDKVLFNKANQILQGGKLGERSQSQQPKLRGSKANDDYMAGVNLSQQSGDLNEEKDDSGASLKVKTDPAEPAQSYFKSTQNVSRKSRTGGNLGAKNRAGSQRRAHHADPNQLHFMPSVHSYNKPPVDAKKNGWLNKFDSQDQSNQVDQNQPKMLENESSRDISHRSAMKLKKKQIVFKRNDVKTSSIARSYRKKAKPEHSPSPVIRYGSLTNRNSGEFRTVRRKRDLMLFTTGKNSRSTTRLDNKFRSRNHSPNITPAKGKKYSLNFPNF